ncbi:M48 family metallopeptidase [Rhodobacteraceae bacterium NNCM2]|nr:M48 family metallopeptidase [Coraliihabitans acroporae]
MTALEQYARLEAPGRYYDGVSANPQNVAVSFGERTLVILGYDNEVNAHWPLASLRGLKSSDQKTFQIMPYADSDERVVLSDEDMIAAIRAVCPDLTRREIDRKGMSKAFVWGGAAIASVLLMAFVIVPALAGQLAFLIPPEREQQVGDAVAKQVQQLMGIESEKGYCKSPEGVAALEIMRERLASNIDLPYPLRIDVLDHKLVNAFAMPGGRIILFRGLIERASSPEEVAGVLAHEIGHVTHRDPTVGVLRAAGTAGILGLLLGDVFGGTVVVAATEAVVNASYQREVETRADETAYQLLSDAGLPSQPFAGFFRTLQKDNGEATGVLRYLSSHPDLAGRAERAAEADRIGDGQFDPILSDRDWLALREICN